MLVMAPDSTRVYRARPLNWLSLSYIQPTVDWLLPVCSTASPSCSPSPSRASALPSSGASSPADAPWPFLPALPAASAALSAPPFAFSDAVSAPPLACPAALSAPSLAELAALSDCRPRLLLHIPARRQAPNFSTRTHAGGVSPDDCQQGQLRADFQAALSQCLTWPCHAASCWHPPQQAAPCQPHPLLCPPPS